MDDNSKISQPWNRHRFRAHWHDYNGGAYFVTVCTRNKVHYFGEIKNGEMELNSLGHKLNECISYAINGVNADIPVYVIMPNHFHCIVVIYGDSDDASSSTGAIKEKNHPEDEYEFIAHHGNPLSNIVGRIKAGVTRYANASEIEFGWQPRFHEHMIRNKEAKDIVNYIQTNPQRWSTDCFNS